MSANCRRAGQRSRVKNEGGLSATANHFECLGQDRKEKPQEAVTQLLGAKCFMVGDTRIELVTSAV